MRLLDLYCGAGGAAYGYALAGFTVTGVDNVKQKYYPYPMIQQDALLLNPNWIKENFDAVHASPPCQAHTQLRAIRWKEHEDLIPATRELLQYTGLPYVIENVFNAPLILPFMLCGTMFGLDITRHRIFETNVEMTPPRDECRWGGIGDGTYRAFVHGSGPRDNESEFRDAMGVGWMSTEASRQAIPPAYTKWIGSRLIDGIQLQRSLDPTHGGA